ncbi:MAG TPA: histidine phosphatase family protein [Paucimonas sp.]|nr:histidine phosphatase family protein [Paucimonas sp.]
MTEILLIRHGETAWNAEKRLQGHLDIPLNAEGERQAAALGAALANEALDAVFSSDLRRALQTAEAVAAPRGMQVIVDQGLRERCFGAFEGLLYSEIQDRYPDAHAAWKARERHARYPAGVHVAETLDEFFARTTGAVDRLLRPGGYRKVALVTHGGVLDCLYRAASGRLDFSAPRDFDVINASINRIRWSPDGMQLLQWADVAHLDPAVLDEIDR